MSKFLMTVWPIETHLTPFVALAHALRARGHDVAFYTGPQSGPDLERQGYRWFSFQELDSGLAERNPGAQSNLKLGLRATRRMWNDFLLGSLPGQIADLERICSDWRPDVMICDMTLWGPILVLQETRRVPVAVLAHTAYCVLPGPQNSAPGISWPPPRSAVGRLAVSILARVMNRAAGVNRDADRIRSRHGLPPLPVTVTEYTGRMPLYLVPSAPAFDYERQDLAASVHYVGLCVSPEEEGAAHAATSMVRRPGGPARVAVLEEAHYAEDPWLLRTAAAAFAGDQVEAVLVAGQGRAVERLGLGTLAPNVRLAPWMPLAEVVRSVDALAVHGNSETVLTALRAGIPMVVLPRILEQPQIAWRLNACGAGIRLPTRQATPARLREAVHRVLETPSFAAAAKRISTALERCGGTARAVELVEGLVSSGVGTRQSAPP
jgi:MGT family glycosyltransferase